MLKQFNDSICVIIVTYNRKELLLKSIDSVIHQSKPPEAIYIIDNHSSDGTPEILLGKGLINEKVPQDLDETWEKEFTVKIRNDQSIPLYYVRMPDNKGGAGGFHEGTKRAFERGFNWLWLMDDDVTFYENALENLIAYKNISYLIQPNKVYFDGKPFYWDGFIDLKFGLQCRTENVFLQNKDFCFVNRSCFEGMLINRDIVERIGFPDARFFAVGDDTVYGILASEYTNPIYLRKVLGIKQRKENTQQRPPLKRYLMMRNRFFKLRYINKYPSFSKCAYIFLLLYLLKYLVASVIKEKSLKNIIAVFSGFKDGIFNKAGNERKFL